MSKPKNSRNAKPGSNSPVAPNEGKPASNDTQVGDKEASDKSDKSTVIEVASSEQESSESKKKGAGKQKLEFEGSLSRQEAVAQLEALAKGLEKGKIQLQAKGQSIELSPSHHYDLELKAASKGSKERVSIELSWRASSDPEQTLKVLVNGNES